MVSDFDTLKQFSQEIASRLVTARRLLEELSTACKALEEDPSSKANSDATHSSPLRRVIDQFSSQLGDAVWINVKSDPQLLHFLEGSEGHPVKKEEAEPNTKIAEAEAPKNPRKRRNTAPLVRDRRLACLKKSLDQMYAFSIAYFSLINLEGDLEGALSLYQKNPSWKRSCLHTPDF